MQYVSLEEGERNTEGNERRRRGKDERENQQQTQQTFEIRSQPILMRGMCCQLYMYVTTSYGSCNADSVPNYFMGADD